MIWVVRWIDRSSVKHQTELATRAAMQVWVENWLFDPDNVIQIFVYWIREAHKSQLPEW